MPDQQQPAEGVLIQAALARSRLSARKAAQAAGISDGRWRQIVTGRMPAGAGQYVTVRGPADTVARMASVVGVTADELESAGRTDAADVLRRGEPTQSTAAPIDLTKVSAEHLVAELQRRLIAERQGEV